MKPLFTILLNWLSISILCAQGNPNDLLMRTDTVRTCFARFTDNGGINGNYSPNLNQNLVLCPPAAQSADTNKISISFNQLELGSGDMLCIFDGIGVNAPALGCNTDFVNRVARATTSNTSGCLTVTFTSNAVEERAGWDANVRCDRACQNFLGKIDYSSKPIVPADTGWIDLCVNETLILHAKGIYLQNNMPHLQADSNTIFAWSFGDDRSTASGQEVQRSFTRPGGYILQLSLTDTASNCKNINTIQQRIRVAPKPVVQVARLPNPVCVNTPFRLNAVTNRFDSIVYNIGVIGGTDSFASGSRRRVDSLALPDDGGEYSTTLNIQGFPAGQTLMNANDLVSVCLNMEHSWIRDLEMTLQCPNGQRTILHNYTTATGNEWYLGQPNDGDGLNPMPGIGWNYCWTPTATQTFRDYMAANQGLPAPRTLPAANYAPFQSFNNLVGCPLNGDWSIRVRDLWRGDNGFIFSWALQLNYALRSVSERFTVPIAQHGWVHGTNITQNNGDSIVAIARNPGFASFVYRVKDDFNCTTDTSIAIRVLPQMHPNCLSCAPRFNDLKDTSMCSNEPPLRLNKIALDSLTQSVTFEAFPNKILSSFTNPVINPLPTPIHINSLQPLTLTDIYTQLDSVCVELNTRYPSDMIFKLKAPNINTALTLMSAPSIAPLRNLNLCFSPNATALLNAATPVPAPYQAYQGNYQITSGRSGWAALNGATLNGDWILQTSDLSGANLDTLKRWSISFKHQNKIKYSWSPSTGLSCTDCPNPTANPLVTTTYIVNTIDSSRCTHRDTVTVTVQSGLPAPVVVLDSMLNGSLLFRWGAIAGAMGYQVNVNNTGWIASNRPLAHQVTGLQASNSVAIQVRAIPSVVTACGAAIGFSYQVYGRVCLFDLQYDSLQTVPIACYGGSTRIQLTALNAAQPTQFSIDGVTQVQNPIFSAIQAGTHFALGIDNEGCRDSLYFTLRQPDLLQLTTTATPSIVGGATGTATVAVMGGVPPYRYSWLRGDTTSTVRNLAANTYTVTITDANGCRKTAPISIITNHLKDELSEKWNIRIYPNPLMDNKLQIDFAFKQPLQTPLNLELRDALGRLISNLGTISETGHFEKVLPNLSKGAYFLIFQSGHLKTVKSIYIF